MKKITFIPLLMLLVISCTSKEDSSIKNLAVVEKYIHSVEQLNHETMTSLLDDEYLGIGPSYGDTIRKIEAVANWKLNVENLYDKIEYIRSRNIPMNIDTGENQGEWVSNWAELHITYKGDRGKVIIWANSIYQIKNNKIVKSYTFYNEADALEQLGYVFINPNNL